MWGWNMFQNRKDAKEKLAQALEKYKGGNLLFLLFHVVSGGGITGCIETKRGFFPPKKTEFIVFTDACVLYVLT